MASNDDGIPSVKVVLLGSTKVGKTSIVSVLHSGEFFEDQSATVGACFQVRKCQVGDQCLKLHIWDTAGQEKFRSLTPMYYRDSQFAVLVYAIDDEDSFKEMRNWYSSLSQDCATMPKLVLVGNKTDLRAEDVGVVSTAQGEELAREIGAEFYEISAKTEHQSVVSVFDNIASVAVKDIGVAAATEFSRNPKAVKSSKKSCCA